MSLTIEDANTRSASGAVRPEAVPAAPNLKLSNSGSLIDADLAREAVQLRDLQKRQSVATTDINRTPRTLLSLFGDA